MFALTSSQWNLSQSTKLSGIYTRESKNTYIDLRDDCKFGQVQKTLSFWKIQTIFLRKSVLQTKTIDTAQVVITGG